MAKKRNQRTERSKTVSTPDHGLPPEPDLDRATDLVMQLMAIPGPSGGEAAIVDFVTRQLRQAGAPADAIRTDQAHRRTPLAGETGNLVFRLRGTKRAPRRLLMAHLDTVPLCVGARPQRRGQLVRSANPHTGLGADNRAGAAVVLTAAIEILRRGLPHPPLTFFWPVQEEIGLQGARHATLGLLGKPKLAFNFDGGAPTKLTVGATGGYRMTVHIEGRASHAGGAPEQGVSAITIAALAIADLQQNGWLGAITKGRHRGTSNIGVIQGGDATNVVTEAVLIRAEARSHNATFRRRIVREIENAFQRAAGSVRNIFGASGKASVQGQLDYESFRLPATEPCILAAEAAVQSVGQEVTRFLSNGGLDANWMTARGIPTVTLGCGQLNQHTRDEQLHVPTFQLASRIALRLATGCG